MRRYLVIGLTTVFVIVAVILALTATPIFRAEVVVTPVKEDGMGGAESLMNQFGGLASLVGVNLQLGDSNQEGAAVLRSRRLTELFIQRYAPLEKLFEGSDEREPTLWKGVKKFRENVITIEDDDSTGLTTVAIDWTDPDTAALWANQFVALANEVIRARAIEESNRNIKYINEQLKQTEVVELRSVMYRLIESETKRLMITNGRTEYAFTVIDPAVPPEIKNRPKRTLMVVAGAVLGFLIGVVSALFFNALRRYRNASVA